MTAEKKDGADDDPLARIHASRAEEAKAAAEDAMKMRKMTEEATRSILDSRSKAAEELARKRLESWTKH